VLPKVQENGVLLTAAGDRVLRFSPPLVVSLAELEEGVRAVKHVCEDLASSRQGTAAPKAVAAI
jgi:acetylornithine/succinyldiaminopimelate/putrescine aminotransferase